jgi:predicted dehydrogenase
MRSPTIRFHESARGVDAVIAVEQAGRNDGQEPLLRVAVIGLGYWGPNLVRVLDDVPGVEIACICDVRREALDAIGRRYRSLRRTDRPREIFDDPSVDAVAIATPVSSHFALVADALRARKHVFVEKPLAASSEQASELVVLAERLGLLLMPGHTFLYSPPVNAIRSLIRSGDLGEIYFVSTSRVNLGLHQPDVSVAWDLGPHDFSILRYWMDAVPTRVSAVSRACVIPDLPDVAFINLQFASGTIANVELSWLAPSKLRRTAVVGSQKMVVYDDTSNEPVRIFDSGVIPPNPRTYGEYRLSYRAGDVVSPRIAADEPLFLEMLDFRDSIRLGTAPRSSSAIGLDVIRMCEAVDDSLAANGSLVEPRSLEATADVESRLSERV